MKLHNRILSTLLAVIMMLSALSVLSVISVSAADVGVEGERIKANYVSTIYETPEEKLATMILVSHLNNEHTRLYVDPVSGEIATENIATGEILFSNPYDIGNDDAHPDTKAEKLMSQVIVHFTENDQADDLYSFRDAAMKKQITVLNIKGGIRVEYIIGDEATRKLVPGWISVDNFEKFIKGPIEEAMKNGDLDKFTGEKVLLYYTLQDPNSTKIEAIKQSIIANYPITEEYPIYALISDATETDKSLIEDTVKAFCLDYTFEQMDADNEATKYPVVDEQSPVFKLALEYSLDENGALIANLSCNGLRYDMATYTLEYINVLPFMGAGNGLNAGYEYENYNFFPDGSGSLFDLEQLHKTTTSSVKGKVYGLDFAYHEIPSGVTYQKAIRYPVYGTVASERLHTFYYKKPIYTGTGADKTFTGEFEVDPVKVTVSNTIASVDELEAYVKKIDPNAELIEGVTTESYQRGYVAIIEAGDSLAEIATMHDGSRSPYHTMMNYFNPKPKDTYDLADSLSVSGASTSWTVVSERKYSGSITIRYQMLTDYQKGQEAKQNDPAYTGYDTSWLGMAEAYRDYLIKDGKLKKLDNELEANIPLYLETFGALETKQQIATIPVDVMTPLTTFEDVWTMYTELSDKGVSNINFKLTGYANGGMYYTVPAKLKWEKAVGGAKGFKELIEKVKNENENTENHVGVYPDFDFAYIQENTAFDSTSLKKDAVKTIDDRYSSFRQYSATQQSYVSFYQLAISPSRYSKFYEKLLGNYGKYGLNSMSVASLGTALNSDFDEDDPYNREDGKDSTVQAFKDLEAAGYSLMTDGSNAYTWGYVDHIINVDLDSSRYTKSSASVPFIGAVLHGYVQFAGAPFNEEGDTDYAILRAIENGAGIYFILSYQNTQELKEDSYLSQYYSVRYDIWKEDMVEYYKELNNALKDVQDKVIVKHQFLPGERVLDPDELQADLEEELKRAEEEEKNKLNSIEIDKILTVADAWKNSADSAKKLRSMIDAMNAINQNELDGNYQKLLQLTDSESFAALIADVDNPDYTDEDRKAAIENLKLAVSNIRKYTVGILKGYQTLQAQYAEVEELLTIFAKAKEIIENSDMEDSLKQQMVEKLPSLEQTAKDLAEDAKDLLDDFLHYVETADGAEDQTAVTQALTIMQQYADSIEEICGEDYIFTAEDLKEEAEKKDEESEESGNVTVETDKYFVDNNQIVVVTYGTRDDATFEKTEYKSFILNYNTFAVKISFQGKSYTIPGGGYVVLYA